MNYNEFNKFQSEFFTSIERFNQNSNYNIKQFAFLLLNTIMKGFPHIADEIYNIYSPDLKAIQSPTIIKALQHRFVNNYSHNTVPNFSYWKGGKINKPKVVKQRVKKGEIPLVEFEIEVVETIKSKLMMDSKTYNYLKFTPKVQKLGHEITKNLSSKPFFK